MKENPEIMYSVLITYTYKNLVHSELLMFIFPNMPLELYNFYLLLFVRDTTYLILAFHQICNKFSNVNYPLPTAVWLTTSCFHIQKKKKSFYLVRRPITIVQVILLYFVLDLDLKYLIEFVNCSSWMNSTYSHFNE